MKIIPTTISRKVASSGLLASEHSPRVLFVAGVTGMIGSTVLACRATLQLSDKLDEIEAEKARHEQAKHFVDSGQAEEGTTYSDREYKRDITTITVKGLGSVARLYAPSVLLGAASVAALTKSHNILQDRNLALTAAYAAVDGAFNRYRERVIDRYGEETDRELRYESEKFDEIDEETGKIVSREGITGAPGSIYARWYDKESSRNWSPDPRINLLFLKQIQNYANDRLRTRGHVFLNEVLSDLGLSHTKAGAIVGWRWQKNSGDNCIDFGIWDGNYEVINDFFNGREGAILLDFNVDGVIYDKIEEGY